MGGRRSEAKPEPPVGPVHPAGKRTLPSDPSYHLALASRPVGIPPPPPNARGMAGVESAQSATVLHIPAG